MLIVTYGAASLLGASLVVLAIVVLRAGSRGALRYLLAGLAFLASLLTFASIGVPFVAFFSSLIGILVAVMLTISIVRSGRPVPLTLLLVTLFSATLLALAQPLGLKVINLPKADALPYEPARFRVLKTYDEGVWFESVRVGPDGTLYLAANIGLDFNRADYFHDAHGQVIARAPNGTERVVFATPKGALTGCFAIAADGTIFMASNGITPGIWKITRDGRGVLFASLPQRAWPNGLAFGPDGMLYSSDSSLGLIWSINPQTGAVNRAIQDKALSARSFISLAPGANGLQFRDNDLIVTVSDRTTVLAYELRDGHFGSARVLARGIPGDDFGVGSDGSLFVTTHPYNTLVRVTRDGARTIVGNAMQHIVGATDAQFGRTDSDRDTLYVVTDGGAFSGGSATRGELVALYPYAKR